MGKRGPKPKLYPNGEKPCSKCGAVLPLESFCRTATTACGRMSWCKSCRYAALDRWRRETEAGRAWARRNNNSNDYYKRLRRSERGDKLRAYQREAQRKHRAKVRARTTQEEGGEGDVRTD